MKSYFLNGGMIGPTLDFGDTTRYQIGTTQQRTTITNVGGQTLQIAGTTSSASVSFSTQPAAGDLVIVAYAVGTGTQRNPTLSITGYTQIADLFISHTTVSTRLYVGYKFMGATPDTSFTRSATGNISDAGAIAVQILRNVDATTPLDVTASTRTGTGTDLASFNSITPVTTNAIVLAIGASGHTNGFASYSNPLDTTFFRQTGSGDDFDVTVGIGGYTWTSGALTPATWNPSGTDSTNFSNIGVTLAIRPALIDVPVFGNLKNSGMWNLEAAYDYAFSQYTPPSQVLFTTTGAQSWTVPVGITEISAVCVGGGGGGAGGDGGRTTTNNGGGGGGLAYGTFAVTPGEVLTVTVGAGGASATGGDGVAGGASTIARGATVLLSGGGGSAGREQNGGTSPGGTSTGTEREGGAAGGAGGTGSAVSGGTGGGGAGGYSAAGGNGGGATAAGASSTGGGGGGGGGISGTTGVAGSGGGVGVLGAGSNGTGGSSGGNGGTGGSGGTTGSTNSTTNTGSLYGGGGGGRSDSAGTGAPGRQGAVRIIWGPGRSYPSTNTGDVF